MNTRRRKIRRDIVPTFMKAHRGKGLESFTLGDFDFDSEETKKALAALSRQLDDVEATQGWDGAELSPADRRAVVDRAPYQGTRKGRPEVDDLEMLLLVADEVLRDLETPSARRISWSKAVTTAAGTLPEWSNMNCSQQVTLVKRLVGKFQDNAAPLLELAIRRRRESDRNA